VGHHCWKVCRSEADLGGMKTTTKDMEKIVEGCEKIKGETSTREKTFSTKVTDLALNFERIKLEENKIPSKNSVRKLRILV
jgi:hypothetical protein